MDELKTIKELEKAFKKIDSVVSGDTAFMAKASLFSIKRLDVLLTATTKDKFHWLVKFMKNNDLVIGNREGDGFKELSFEELHTLYGEE